MSMRLHRSLTEKTRSADSVKSIIKTYLNQKASNFTSVFNVTTLTWNKSYIQYFFPEFELMTNLFYLPTYL